MIDILLVVASLLVALASYAIALRIELDTHAIAAFAVTTLLSAALLAWGDVLSASIVLCWGYALIWFFAWVLHPRWEALADAGVPSVVYGVVR